MMKKLRILLITACLCACSPKEKTQTENNTIRVGTIAGPETSLMEVAAATAQKKYGLTVVIVTFNDYIQPNIALAEGSLDANMFQHKPYLDEQIRIGHYALTPVAVLFTYPMGIYSKKITSLAQLNHGGLVGIPNDPTNEGRALLLLQQANIIQLKPTAGFTATPADIILNPRKLRFKELDAALLPRALDNLDIAIINTTYAAAAKLSPAKDALYLESKKSPYANILVVRTQDATKKTVLELIDALHSDEVVKKAQELFPGGAAVPAWDNKTLTVSDTHAQ